MIEHAAGGRIPEPTMVPVRYSVAHGCYYVPSEVIEMYGKEFLDKINANAKG